MSFPIQCGIPNRHAHRVPISNDMYYLDIMGDDVVKFDPLGIETSIARRPNGSFRVTIAGALFAAPNLINCLAYMVPLYDVEGHRIQGDWHHGIHQAFKVITPPTLGNDLWIAVGIADTNNMTGLQCAGGLHYDAAPAPNARALRANGFSDSAAVGTEVHGGFATGKDKVGHYSAGFAYNAFWTHIATANMIAAGGTWSADMWQFVAIGTSAPIAFAQTIDFFPYSSHVTCRPANRDPQVM